MKKTLKEKNSKILKKDFYIHETRVVSMPKKRSKDNRKTNK